MNAERPAVRYDAERRNEGAWSGWTKVCRQGQLNLDFCKLLPSPFGGEGQGVRA